MCHSRQASHHHAKRYPVGQTNPRRASIVSHHHKNKHFSHFQDHPHHFQKTLSTYLMMPTCVPFTPGESPSCQKISSWPDESEESKHSVPPPQKQTFQSFSGPPPSLPKNLSTAHQEVAFPEVGEGDRPGLQDRPAILISGNTVSPGSSGGLPCQAI